MGKRSFTIDIDDFILGAAFDRAQREGKSPEQILVDLITAYAKGESMHPPAPPSRPAPASPATPEPVTSRPPTDPGEPQPIPTPPAPAFIGIDPTAAIAGQKYLTIPIVGSPTDRPAANHGDINLALRGYKQTTAPAKLIDMSGPTDSKAPQLSGLFEDQRTPNFTQSYRVRHWDWGSNNRGAEITDFEVTLLGMATSPGEIIHVPPAGYEIGRGLAVMVLYATAERLTLTYTGEDSIVHGYSLHIEGVHVEPSLLALYDQMNAAGRRELPGLRANQPLGRALADEIRVAIRDTGRFMDPRVRKDWWRGR